VPFSQHAVCEADPAESQDNLADLQIDQSRIQAAAGIRYPLMKLRDMYFWQIGSEADGGKDDQLGWARS
jgi:hypothetical protein